MRTLLKRIFSFLERHAAFQIGVLSTLLVFSIHPVFPYRWVPEDLASLLQSFEERTYDAFFRIRGEKAVSDRVVIIDIDEKSLRELGQWPWPRNAFAQMLTTVGAGKPKAVGLDIVFSEPDRFSFKQSLPLLKRMLGSKAELPVLSEADGD
jgi:adenylate cyclase